MVSQPMITLNDGRCMPQLGLGLYKVPAEQTAALVAAATASGYCAFDTAAAYFNEAATAQGERDSGVQSFLTSKVWISDLGFERTLAACERSLQAMQRDSLDLLLIHWPSPAKNLYVDSWRALIRLREEGKVTSIGVSNFHIAHLQRLIDETGVVPVLNQVELHPSFQQRSLRAYHASQGIQTQCWSPLGHGALLRHPAILEIARRTGHSPAQVIIRWHLQHGLLPIPKTASAERAKENFAALDFVLNEQDMRSIDALDRADGRGGPDPDSL